MTDTVTTDSTNIDKPVTEDGTLTSSGKNDLVDKDYEATKQREAESLAEILAEVPDFSPREFDHTFADFFLTNPFLGALTMEVTKVFDIRQPTAYIGVRPNGRQYEIVLGMNPKFFREMVSKHRHGVLKHEIYHMIFQHIFSRAVGDTKYAKLHNYATDLAINSIIGKENLPLVCLIPGERPLQPEPMVDKDGNKIIDPRTKKQVVNRKKLVPVFNPYADFIATAPKDQSSDYYFEELRKIQDQQGDGEGDINVASGLDTLDSHDSWGDLPVDVQEQIRDRVKGMVGNAANKATRDNSWGDIPLEIQEAIRAMCSNEVDWKSIIKSFVGRCKSTDRNSTVRKINKKMPYIHPGVKRPLISKLAVFIDQSGSMSDENICMLFGELENLSKLSEIDVWHFDTEVDLKSKTAWKKGKTPPKPHRTRCGGTDFQAVVDFANSKENRGIYSGIIILTDGYAGKPGQIIGARTLYVITAEGSLDAIPSGSLYCQIKKEKQFKKI